MKIIFSVDNRGNHNALDRLTMIIEIYIFLWKLFFLSPIVETTMKSTDWRLSWKFIFFYENYFFCWQSWKSQWNRQTDDYYGNLYFSMKIIFSVANRGDHNEIDRLTIIMEIYIFLRKLFFLSPIVEITAQSIDWRLSWKFTLLRKQLKAKICIIYIYFGYFTYFHTYYVYSMQYFVIFVFFNFPRVRTKLSFVFKFLSFSNMIS